MVKDFVTISKGYPKFFIFDLGTIPAQNGQKTKMILKYGIYYVNPYGEFDGINIILLDEKNEKILLRWFSALSWDTWQKFINETGTVKCLNQNL